MTTVITLKQAKLSLPFLFSGLALVIYIFLGVKLFYSLIILFAPSLFIVIKVSQKLSITEKIEFTNDIKKGANIGVLATASYDAIRFILYSAGAVNFFPFETFRHFGNALIGDGYLYSTYFIVGTIYHILNGITFSIAYTICFKGKNFVYGIAWALGLEILMLISYTNWASLNLEGKMSGFLIVSLVGHFTYGATVGFLNQYQFKSKR